MRQHVDTYRHDRDECGKTQKEAQWDDRLMVADTIDMNETKKKN